MDVWNIRHIPWAKRVRFISMLCDVGWLIYGHLRGYVGLICDAVSSPAWALIIWSIQNGFFRRWMLDDCLSWVGARWTLSTDYFHYKWSLFSSCGRQSTVIVIRQKWIVWVLIVPPVWKEKEKSDCTKWSKNAICLATVCCRKHSTHSCHVKLLTFRVFSQTR